MKRDLAIVVLIAEKLAHGANSKQTRRDQCCRQEVFPFHTDK